ncbi:MAG: radical SAM protein [Candidatus Woesearchaeota archaeon]
MKLSKIVEIINNREDMHYRAADDFFQLVPMFESGKVSGYEIILRITNKCNMFCNYCFIDREKKSLSENDILKIIKGLSRANFSGIYIQFTISGGEPVLHKHFFEIIDFLLKKGVGKIVVQTNASLFSNPEMVSKLPDDRNKISFFSSFCSHKKDVFNSITSSDKYDDAVMGIKNLSEKYNVALNFVVVKENYVYLDTMVDFFIKNFNTDNLSFSLSNIGIVSKRNLHLYLEKYRKIQPHVLRALIFAKENNIPANFTFSGGCGFPLCVIRSFSERFFRKQTNGVLFKADKNIISIGNFKSQFYKLEKCSLCVLNDYCQGFTSAYVSMFGDCEIDPILDSQ